MGTDPEASSTSSPAPTCVDCGAPVEETFGGIAICGDCLTTRGSCCAESEAADPAVDDARRDYASSPCYAHYFDDGDEDRVEHDRGGGTFHTRSGARLEYTTPSRGKLEITHTFVPENLQGQGLASRLMKAALRHADREKLHVSASCDYAKGYLQRKRASSANG